MFSCLSRSPVYHMFSRLSHVLPSITCSSVYHMFSCLSHVLLSLTCSPVYPMFSRLSHVLLSLTCSPVSHMFSCLSHVLLSLTCSPVSHLVAPGFPAQHLAALEAGRLTLSSESSAFWEKVHIDALAEINEHQTVIHVLQIKTPVLQEPGTQAQEPLLLHSEYFYFYSSTRSGYFSLLW